MKFTSFVGLSSDARFRQAMEALVQAAEGAVLSQSRLVAFIKAQADRRQRDSIIEAIGSNDQVGVENFRLTRIDQDNWLVEKAWDVDEAIARCEPMRKALEHLALDSTADLRDEIVWQAFWERWQAEYTEWYRALPPADKELWDEDDFPLEPYRRKKAQQIFERLRARFGSMPELTRELCFWFTCIAEALPPEE